MTVFPEEGEDKKRTQNHPFIACEILSESSPVHDKIAESDELLSKLLSLLSEEKPNSTLIGYFSKVMLALIFRSSEKLILYLNSSNYMSKLVNHISHRGICDVSLKLLSADGSSNSQVLSSQQVLLSSLISCLIQGSRFQTQNSALVISDMLIRTPDVYSKSLIELLISNETITILFECLKSQDSFRIVAAANILKTLLQANLKLSLKSLTENYFSGETFKENLNWLIEVLRRSKGNKFVNTMKCEFEPLGEDRLKVVELVGVLSRIPDDTVINVLALSGIFTVITELFFEYKWHSILHTTFESMFLYALNGQNEEMLNHFVLSSEFLVNVFNTCAVPGDKHRLGNLGIILRLANALKNSNNPLVVESLKENAAWKIFIQSYVEVRNMIDQKQLGEIKRKHKSSSSDEGLEINLPGHKEPEKSEENEEKVEINEENPGELEVKIEVIKEENSENNEITEKFGKLEINIEEKENHVLTEDELKRLSPLAKRRLSGGPLSPNAHPDYNHANFWKIQVLVDELDGLELE